MIKNIDKNIYQICFEKFGCCVYLIKEPDKNILIDTSTKENREELIQDLEQLNLKISDIDYVLLTHSHWDHTGNLEIFKNSKILTQEDFESPSIGQALKNINLIPTPGHTEDSVCYLYKDDTLFSGDTIFRNGYIGRTDFPESDPDKMQKSLEKLKTIKYTKLCPGHDDLD